MDISRLMFRREHFHVILFEGERKDGVKFWHMNPIEIPPYHPSMREKGIPFEFAPRVVKGALENTLLDIQEIVSKMPRFKSLLSGINSDYTFNQKEDGIYFEHFPIVEHFFIGRENINPYGIGGDQGICIDLDIASGSFEVPESVVFPEELMKEYGMTDAGISFGSERRIECPNLWHRHNLDYENALFYKNLVIALNNAVVRKKYERAEGERGVT